MITFEPGKFYSTRSACNYDCIITARIIKRTARTVTAEVEGKVKTFRPSIYDGAGEVLRELWHAYCTE